MLRRSAPLFLLAVLLALPASVQAEGRIVSALGEKQVRSETVYVDVVVAVPPRLTDRQAADRALSELGAVRRKKPPWAGGPGGPGGGGGGGGAEEYFYTGLKWSSFPVVQSYNGAGDPIGAAAILQNTQAAWSGIANSSFRMSYGGTTERCPSLVNECPGAQYRDGFQDVAWLRLGPSTLGVTWYTTSTPEADMALNTRFTWKKTCDSSGSGYDVGTVLLHENGHVAGLDHVNRTDSVMYPSYQDPRCTLYSYDERSMANLY